MFKFLFYQSSLHIWIFDYCIEIFIHLDFFKYILKPMILHFQSKYLPIYFFIQMLLYVNVLINMSI